MAKLFPADRKGLLFAAHIDLQDTVGEGTSDIELAMGEGQSGSAVEVVRRIRLERILLYSLQVVNQHFIRRRTYEVKTFCLRIDSDVLKTPASSSLPLRHRPLGHEFSFRVENLDAAVAWICDIDAVAFRIDCHGCRFVELAVAGSLGSPDGNGISVNVQLSNPRAALVDYIHKVII